MKYKRGRPKKLKSDRRSKPLRILLTVTERAELDGFAKVAALETSTWARGILLGVVRQKEPQVSLSDVR